ncbi:hypothetical protein OK016_16225 [Vibrio chagasii]|nr:hypothetical protein [Vibrio chagasii]
MSMQARGLWSLYIEQQPKRRSRYSYGSSSRYQVVATINDKANGDIINVLTVDGDTISHDISQTVRQIDYEKTFWL